MSLKKQTFSGLIWTFFDTVLLKGSAFAAQLILARLLGPSEFGLIGMIAIFIAVGNSLIDSGLSSSLIRTVNADNKDYNTVFYSNLSISIIVYLVIYFIAPFIAKFYAQSILTSLVRVYCLSFIISAFTAVQLTIQMKEMRFKRLTLLNIPATLVGITTGITLGYKGYGVWSIVWMYLANQLTLSLCLWITSSWRPEFSFSMERIRYHFGFGYKLMLSGLLNTTFDNVYNVIIGRFYNVKTLGYYERAYQFNQYPVTALTGIISKVTYPMLSSIQHDKEKITTVYRNIIQLIFFISAPLMLGAAAVARPLFHLVLGAEWLPAVPFFQILCFSSILFPIHAFNLNVLKIFGRSDLFLKLEILKKTVIAVAVLVSFYFGIYALVWSGVATSFIALIINTYYSGPLINYSVKQQLRDMLPGFLLACATTLVMFGTTYLLGINKFSLQIVTALIAGGATYIFLNVAMKTPLYQLAKTHIKK